MKCIFNCINCGEYSATLITYQFGPLIKNIFKIKIYLKSYIKKNSILLSFPVDNPVFVKYLKEAILKHLNDDFYAAEPKNNN